MTEPSEASGKISSSVSLTEDKVWGKKCEGIFRRMQLLDDKLLAAVQRRSNNRDKGSGSSKVRLRWFDESLSNNILNLT